MTSPVPLRPAPEQVLIISSRLDPGRRRALAGLAGPGSRALVVELGGSLPGPEGYDAVVMDGPVDGLDPTWVAAVDAWVTGGGTLMVIGSAPTVPDGSWGALIGVTSEGPPGGPGRAGEWFAKVSPDAGDLGVRLPTEFPVLDRVRPLRAGAGHRVALQVSLAYRDVPVLVTRPVGAGRVVVAGLGNTDQALGHPELALVLRRCLVPPGRSEGPGSSLGLAVIGYGPYGGMGQYHGLAARSTDGLELIATCDPSSERRKAAEADFPGLRAYATVEEVAADADVQVVVVATPPVSHTSVALSLLRAGKHVALEKPMCFTLEEADALIDAARDEGRVLTVNQNRRWDRDFRAVRRVVDEGLLGQLFNLETFVGGFEHPCRAWHSEVSVSGGAVYDWGSHHLDWALLLMGGPPATVVAHGHKRVWHDVTNLDQLRVHLTWDDGREAEFVQSDVAAIRRPKFYLQGTAGSLVGHYRPVTFERMEVGRGYVEDVAHHAEAPAELTLARYESGWGLTETGLPLAPEQPFAFHRNLADHLHRGEPLAVAPGSVRAVIAVLEAAHRSSVEGGPTISLPAL